MVNNMPHSKTWDDEADVVIVGSGAAGLCAAIAAKEKGANLKVIVLEKMFFIGGNTSISTSYMNAAGSSVQEREGIKDSVEIFIEDIMKGGDYKSNPELVRTLAENSGNAVEWLKKMSAPFPNVVFAEGASRPRAHAITEKYGGGLVQMLSKTAKSKGVEIRTETKVTNLLDHQKQLAGVELEFKEKKIKIMVRKALVLAAGGFGANQELVSRYDPGLKGFASTNRRSVSTGECMLMTRAVFNAEIDGINYIQIHPTVYAFEGKNELISEGVRATGAILVNQDGERFVEELERRNIVAQSILKQKGGYAFLITDNNLKHSKVDGYKRKGLIQVADTLEELALKQGIDSIRLTETVSRYNSYVTAGKDADFQRRNLPGKIEIPPYYIIKVTPAVHHCTGGLMINTKAQVIDVWKQVIPGLFAAGEITGGIHGTNRLGGNAILECIVFGRIAGYNAALGDQWIR